MSLEVVPWGGLFKIFFALPPLLLPPPAPPLVPLEEDMWCVGEDDVRFLLLKVTLCCVALALAEEEVAWSLMVLELDVDSEESCR